MNEGRVLITGAGGFIGSALGNFLTSTGYSVTGLDTRYAETNAAPVFDFHIADFRDRSRVSELSRDVEIVIHLASAHLGIRMTKEEYWDTNVNSLDNFLKDLANRGVTKFVHFSSVSVYGNLKSWPADEQAECLPQSVYGQTKLAGEKVVADCCLKTGLAGTILRPAWVFGATCPRTRRLYRSLRDGTFVMIGKGQNLRHPLYITDMLNAVVCAMKRTDPAPAVFNVGGPSAVTTAQLIESMCSEFGFGSPRLRIPYSLGAAAATVVEKAFTLFDREPPVSRRTLEFFNTNNAFDIRKAATGLGFRPEYSLVAALADCRNELQQMN